MIPPKLGRGSTLNLKPTLRERQRRTTFNLQPTLRERQRRTTFNLGLWPRFANNPQPWPLGDR
ncbi:MAG: hypothetical protein F6K56_43885 [Moorea sp. SIO3G5]|nr:hypothetical protein [Moorena sp. SIO3G5]